MNLRNVNQNKKKLWMILSLIVLGFVLVSNLFWTDLLADENGMAKQPPSTPDKGIVVEPVHSPEAIDPEMIQSPPPTEAKVQADKGSTGAIITGVCMKDKKTTGAVSKKECRRLGGTWHETAVNSPGRETRTQSSGGVRTTP